MKKLLVLTGVAEAATGVALLVAPALVGRLLLGAELTGVSVVVARVAGIALFALGVGCWPGPASLGMLTYNTLGTVYFGWLALGTPWCGPLLWPVVGLHALLTLLLSRAWVRERGINATNARTDQ
ncbi:MAG TPA: hypothetical protein VMJ12_03610 [Candidatus Acidoferrales bacterium]|nr:hypothetical protein [Candidatus Acidoferrales bacterium]